jgi:hypothetical protein
MNFKNAMSSCKNPILVIFLSGNPHLHERVSNHRDQKYIGEVSLWPAEYRNRPPKVPLIFNFKNFGEVQKFLIRPEMHYLDAIFCLIQLKQHWNQIIIYKYTLKGNFRRGIFWHY